ncbi:MAG TPA: M56 family metallopeptidase [Blastocatellia bacterium]|nr:M56 family metallopeptidase [Blastocatellia bacterium]
MRSIEFFPLYLDAACKTTMLLLVLCGVLGLLPKTTAATKHWWWTAAVVACLGLPLCTALLPAWRLPLLPSSLAQNTARQPVTNTPIVPVKYAPQWEAMMMEPSSTRAEAPASFDWSIWLAALWALGAGLVVAQSVVGLIVVARMKINAQPLQDEAWQALLREEARTLGLQSRVHLYLSEQVAVPLTTGLFRSCVLLPVAALQWPQTQLRTVLLHELAHIKRRDCLTQMLANLACALYWWNPLLWLAARQMRRLRERACDDEVLAAGTRASDYANCLVNVAQSVPRAKYTAPVTVGMACSQLSERITAILDPTNQRQKLTRRFRMLLVILISSLVLPLAALHPYSQAAEATALATVQQEPETKKQQREVEKHLREIEKHRREIREVHQREIEKHLRALEKLRGAAVTEAQKARLAAEIERAAAAEQSARREIETQVRERITKELEEQLRAEAERMRQQSRQEIERTVQQELERVLRAQQSSDLMSKAQAELLEKRAALSAELERLRREYTETHPVVREQKDRLEALTERMERLERERATKQLSAGQAQLEMKLAELEAQLKTIQRQYTNDHPKVIDLKTQIEALKQELERSLRK